MLPDQCRVPQSAVPLSIQIDLLFRFETPGTLRPRCQPSDDTIPDFHPTLWVTPMDIYSLYLATPAAQVNQRNNKGARVDG